MDCHTEAQRGMGLLQTGRDPENSKSLGSACPPSLAEAQREMRRGGRLGPAGRVSRGPGSHAPFKEGQLLSSARPAG